MGTANNDKNFSLPSYEDIFTSELERAGTNPVEIPISEIDDFPGHPFHVTKDDDMKALILSIEDLGQLTPAIVRKSENGRYMMISGHRRKFACNELGIKTLLCQVLDVDVDEATVLMVESNIYRSNVTISEKAFAYKMRFDAIKRMKDQFRSENQISGRASGRIPEYIRGKSKDRTANELGISRTQATRYIRFTYLNDGLLELLDKGKLPQETAVLLSYLDKPCMDQVVAEITDEGASIPDRNASDEMRVMAQDNNLTPDKVHEIMNPGKDTNKEEKFCLRGTEVKKHIPNYIKPGGLEEFVINGLDLCTIFYESKTADEYINATLEKWKQVMGDNAE